MALDHEKIVNHIRYSIENLSNTKGQVNITFMFLKGYFDDGLISESEFKEFDAQLQQIYQELPPTSTDLPS